jgi:hypothetical protein
VRIVDPSDPDRFEVPIMRNEDILGNKKSKVFRPENGDETDYQVYVNQSPFFLQVFRKSTGKLM